MLREIVKTNVKKYVPIDLWTEAETLASNTIDRAKLWRQRAYIIETDEIAPFKIGYIGRPVRLPHALDVLNLREGVRSTPSLGLVNLLDPHAAIFFDGPFPGAWRVPGLLRTLVPLDRSIEEIMAGYEPELRRSLRRLTERSEVRDVTSTAEVLHINREMLVPFALSRHDERAHIMSEEEILRMSREGTLQLVFLDGQPIGAQIGYSYERRGKRYWRASRAGYPEAVFSDRGLVPEKS